MKKLSIICGLTILLGSIVTADEVLKHQVDSKTFESPNKHFEARVVDFNKKDKFVEARIYLREKANKKVFVCDLTSADGEHGRYVLKATWTPSSKFFIFSTESTGLHSVWHTTTFFFSVDQSHFYRLDDAIGSVVGGDFSIDKNGRITLEVRKGADDVKKTIDLETLGKLSPIEEEQKSPSE